MAEAVNGLASAIWGRYWNSWARLIERCQYYQWRNEASYESRRRKPQKLDTG